MSFFGQSPLNDNYIELIIMTLYPKLILDALSTVPYPDSDPHCGVEEVIRIKNHLNERGINYLLNVGPDHLGRFPATATEILLEVGKTL